MEPGPVRWFVDRTRIHRHPIAWVLRPSDVPVSNHRVRRPVRPWRLEEGVDETSLQVADEAAGAVPLRP